MHRLCLFSENRISKRRSIVRSDSGHFFYLYPMNTFPVVGQKGLYQALKKQYLEGYLPHCQLFVDKDGYGGLPLALVLSQLILDGDGNSNTTGIHDHPDLHFVYPTPNTGKEKSTSFESLWRSFYLERPYGSTYDWLELLDAGNKQGAVRVEAVLHIQKQAALKAFAGQNKVFIFWGAELILEQAANKLLKLLEEPPEKSFFLLIAEHTDSILPTVLSRCQLSHIPPIAKSDLLEFAIKKFPLEEKIAEKIDSVGGSWRRLLATIENADEIRSLEKIWVDGLRLAFRARGNKKIILSLFDWAQAISQLHRESQKHFLVFGLDLFRNAMVLHYGAHSANRFTSFTGFDLNKFAAFVHAENVIAIQRLLEESYFQLSRNANPKILFTTFSLSLSRLLNKKELPLSENVNEG